MEDTMTERILNLTLEIIYQLSGQSCSPVKSGDHLTIMVPPCHSMKPERDNMKKILEVITKMMELLMGEGGVEGDVMDNQPSLWSWDPPDEAPSDERSPSCKAEPLEEWNSTHIVHSPKDLPHLVSVSIKEEPDPGENVISRIIEHPSISEEGNLPHTDVSMDGDLPHSNVSTHHSPTQVKEELFVSDEPFQEPHVSPPCPPSLVPQEASSEGEVTDRAAVCFKWNVDPQGVLRNKKLNPQEEATLDNGSPSCNEEPLEERNPTDIDHPELVSVGMKKEPNPGDIVISPIIERLPISEEGNLLHTDVSMDGDLPQAKVKEELFVSNEEPSGEPDISPQCPPILVPRKDSLEREVTDGGAVCFKWNVVDAQEELNNKKLRQILPKLTDDAGSCTPFFCTECGKFFQNNEDLIQHLKVHSEEKSFQCLDCEQCFSKQSSLAVHRSHSHGGRKPLTCVECGLSFSTKAELTNHGKIHTRFRPYSCPECGKLLCSPRSLFQHQKIHTDGKKFICSECGKSFRTRSQMIVHQRVHTGEKPYQCLECYKCCSRKADLIKHQRIHTGLKPYTCLECNKSYCRRFDLNQHRKTHVVAKP
ncbi:uncharacterized protein [Pyxicephalus adspersus]|uniref:uncharacterized protein isoform X2 n=1 Tax=Pyxicephalus adspersus TaxID=30357 RepID=UPI003B5A8BF5